MTDTSFGAALSRLWPHGDERVPGLRAGIAAAAPAVFAKYGISSPLLVAHVMAQISHECGAGGEVVENLNYSAGRMTQVWPSRFPNLARAIPFAKNPRKLANQVYNGRMGNRPGSDDGWTFRGRGASQTTGREGYERLAAKTGLDLLGDPDLVNNPAHFLECGVADFVLCGCLPFAARDDLRGATLRLNGGLTGLSERATWLSRWKGALALGSPVAAAPVAPARPAGVLQFGDTGFEVKALQDALIAKGYVCGADDGEFHEATRDAVLACQANSGLQATGVADLAFKSQLPDLPDKPVSEARSGATAQDLREAGSRTIAGTDRLGFVGRCLKWLGLGLTAGAGGDHVGAFDLEGLDLDRLQSGIDRAHQAYGMLDSVKGLLKPLFSSTLMLPIAAGIAIAGIVIWRESRGIARARVDDHRSGANMGR